MQVDGLVLEWAPQALGEDVARAPASAVHGDGSPGVLDHGDQLHAGELNALIGFEDLGAVVALQGACEGIGAEAGIPGGGSSGDSPRIAATAPTS